VKVEEEGGGGCEGGRGGMRGREGWSRGLACFGELLGMTVNTPMLYPLETPLRSLL
jgi:hypothetical protein